MCSVAEIIAVVTDKFNIDRNFYLQYHDDDFSEFMNLDELSEIAHSIVRLKVVAAIDNKRHHVRAPGKGSGGGSEGDGAGSGGSDEPRKDLVVITSPSRRVDVANGRRPSQLDDDDDVS